MKNLTKHDLTSKESYDQCLKEARNPATAGDRLIELVMGDSSSIQTLLRDACLVHPNFPLRELREWMVLGELTSWTNISAELVLLSAPGEDLLNGALEAAQYLTDCDDPLPAKRVAQMLCATQRQAQFAPCEQQPENVACTRWMERDPTGRATALLLAILTPLSQFRPAKTEILLVSRQRSRDDGVSASPLRLSWCRGQQSRTGYDMTPKAAQAARGNAEADTKTLPGAEGEVYPERGQVASSLSQVALRMDPMPS